MTEETINELLILAKGTALAAGAHIESRRHDEFNVDNKGRGGSTASEILTEVDLEVQKLIEDALWPFCDKYDLGFLGEERVDDSSRFEKNYFWSVDPIDGTLPFTEGISGYSTSIALVRKGGLPIIGVVNDSFNQRIYYAANGLGAYCNDQPIELNNTGQKLHCYFDRSTTKETDYSRLLDEMNKIALDVGFEQIS